MGIVDDAPPDEELQRIVSEVAASFGVPTALVTVVLENEQWFKSYVGIGGDLLAKRGGPRSWAFCHHVVEGRDALVVPDARENPVFADNPYVKEGTIRGYAGAPIVTPQGDVLGSMCIIDTKPLDVGAEGVARLRLIARRVAGELQLNAARRRKERVPNASEAPGAPPEREAVLRGLDVAMETMPCAVVIFDAAGRTLSLNSAFGQLFAVRRVDVTGTRRETLLARIASSFADPDDALARLAAPQNGAFVICEDLVLAADSRMVRWSAAPVDVPGGFIQVVNVW
jgi:PAS domain-containing protein